jgi:hypothetical protein
MTHAHQNGVWLDRPWLTALSFSAGTGSAWLLWAVLLDIIPRPKNFIVVNADPGMENKHTYDYVSIMQGECIKAGIPFIRATGPSLYRELLELKASGATRFDNPPYWTKDRITGKVGQLRQKCTKQFKIAPMDRAIRAWMADNIGVPIGATDMGTDAVRRWIGFTNDEWMRIKEDRKVFEFCEYPLVDLKINRADLPGLYLKHGKPMPPRSVCNACFANDVSYLKAMAVDRPEDFECACLIDDEIRDLTCIGITDECYVSSTCIPLRVLAANGFVISGAIKEQDEVRCHSGHCFT